MLDASAQKYPNRPALYYGLRSDTYRRLCRTTNRWAHMLQNRCGVRPGHKVAILLRNCPEFVYAVFGILRLGATVVPINQFLKGGEIKYILENAGVQTIVSHPEFEAVLGECKGTIKSVLNVGGQQISSWLRSSSEEPIGQAIGPEQDALIIYTSGTTGRPKGAVLTHANIYSNAEASVKTIDMSHTDRLLLILPMFHSFTFTVCLMMPLFVGASVIIVASVQPFSRVLRNMIFRRATLFPAVPQIFQVMATKKIPPWLRPFIRVRLCVSGAAALPMGTLEAFEKNLGIPLLEGYGLSESSPVVSINPLHGKRKEGTVGLPIPGVAVRIVDDDGKVLGTGQVGEIAVKGPNVMKGYLNNPSATAQTIKDGWLLTGDMGFIDEDGYIKIVDRKKDMIIVRGMNVYPKEVEDVLVAHPAVAQAAVLAKQDPHRGETPMAVVILKHGQSIGARDLLAFCQPKLADYKLPRKILFVSDFPRNATGKILKSELAKLF